MHHQQEQSSSPDEAGGRACFAHPAAGRFVFVRRRRGINSFYWRAARGARHWITRVVEQNYIVTLSSLSRNHNVDREPGELAGESGVCLCGGVQEHTRRDNVDDSGYTTFGDAPTAAAARCDDFTDRRQIARSSIDPPRPLRSIHQPTRTCCSSDRP